MNAYQGLLDLYNQLLSAVRGPQVNDPNVAPPAVPQQVINRREKSYNLQPWLDLVRRRFIPEAPEPTATNAYKFGVRQGLTQGLEDELIESSGPIGAATYLAYSKPYLQAINEAWRSGDVEAARALQRVPFEVQRALGPQKANWLREQHEIMKGEHPYAYAAGEVTGIAPYIMLGTGPAAAYKTAGQAALGAAARVAPRAVNAAKQVATAAKATLAPAAGAVKAAMQHMPPRLAAGLTGGAHLVAHSVPAAIDSASYAAAKARPGERMEKAVDAFVHSMEMGPFVGAAFQQAGKAIARSKTLRQALERMPAKARKRAKGVAKLATKKLGSKALSAGQIVEVNRSEKQPLLKDVYYKRKWRINSRAKADRLQVPTRWLKEDRW